MRYLFLLLPLLFTSCHRQYTSVVNRDPLYVEKEQDLAVFEEEGEVLVFTDDHLFSSPSSAASQVLARNANGWKEWKTKGGKTLDELKRK